MAAVVLVVIVFVVVARVRSVVYYAHVRAEQQAACGPIDRSDREKLLSRACSDYLDKALGRVR